MHTRSVVDRASGDGGDVDAVGLGSCPLLHQSREAADKSDPVVLAACPEPRRRGRSCPVRRGGYQGDGSDGDALIDDGNAGPFSMARRASIRQSGVFPLGPGKPADFITAA